MTLEDHLTNDIGTHFAHKLRRLVVDTADTCCVADVALLDIVNLITIPLVCELVLAANAAEIEKPEFLLQVAHIYDGMQTELNKLKIARRKAGASAPPFDTRTVRTTRRTPR